ncbi:MAG: TIR domain-containing protein [Planctomycetes bacterium]|nr:TIR domain-containing protein [Planctomycetota bacterium]
MHRVFVSYHHKDQYYKDLLCEAGERFSLFVDWSVETNDIDESLPDQQIRRIIRDDYLRDSTVTIVLVGLETRNRKHVDWEIYSSMIDGKVNKKSGVFVVMLPQTGSSQYVAAHGEQEKAVLYPSETNWISIDRRDEYEKRYPFAPARVIDNLLCNTAKISVVPWHVLFEDLNRIKFLIDATYDDREACQYDLGRAMQRSNF